MSANQAGRVPSIRRSSIIPIAVLALAIAACAPVGATVGPPTAPPTVLPASAAPTTTATLTPTIEPVATPSHPAPAEMISGWTSDVATLDITATKLAISGVDFPTSMRLEAFGQELVLSHGTICAGDGRYRWSIEGDALRLESIGPDSCERRQKYFDGVTYSRVPS